MRYSKYSRIGLAWLTIFLLAPFGFALAQDATGLKSVLEHELIEEGIRTVDVKVLGSTVELTGAVDSIWQKSKAEDIVLDHDRVEDVRNEITVSSDRSDTSIADDLSRRLRNYVHYGIFDIVGAHVLNGVVTLTGKVTDGYKATEMAKMASRISGVQKVNDEIEVLPVSTQDSELRNAIASGIYGDSMFFRYSTQVSPPIHIIVEHGRVTLVGTVQNRIEKRKAEQIARQTPGAFQVTNELQVASESSSES